MIWKKTTCVCCAQNCGLETRVEDNRIVKVRTDKENPRSQGYVFRKGLRIAHYQHHADRRLRPLKRVGTGFQEIPWEQALDEIAEKARPGQVILPHGFGLTYQGKKHGANVNRLAATPYHRYVPCRVEPA